MRCHSKKVMFMKMKKVSLTPKQEKIARELYGTMFLKDLAPIVGVAESKLQKNLQLMGLYRKRRAKVASFDRNGYFDVDMFASVCNF